MLGSIEGWVCVLVVQFVWSDGLGGRNAGGFSELMIGSSVKQTDASNSQ